MSDINEISNGELFADLQVSLTEIFLIGLLTDEPVDEFRSRLNHNCQIRDAIKGIMKNRFSNNDIIRFLDDGFPRQVDLRNVIK